MPPPGGGVAFMDPIINRLSFEEKASKKKKAGVPAKN
jgi:hypothetical protein